MQTFAQLARQRARPTGRIGKRRPTAERPLRTVGRDRSQRHGHCRQGADRALLKALHNEAKKSQELAHPTIVTVYDFDRENDRIFMTMEYMDGVSLGIK